MIIIIFIIGNHGRFVIGEISFVLLLYFKFISLFFN